MFEFLIAGFIGAIIFIALVLYVIGSLVTAPIGRLLKSLEGDKGKNVTIIVGLIAITIAVIEVIKILRDKKGKK